MSECFGHFAFLPSSSFDKARSWLVKHQVEYQAEQFSSEYFVWAKLAYQAEVLQWCFAYSEPSS